MGGVNTFRISNLGIGILQSILFTLTHATVALALCVEATRPQSRTGTLTMILVGK